MADPADLEQLAVRLEQTGDYRVLRRIPVVTRYTDDDPTTVKRLGLIVDIETTGLDPASDRIIELACLPFHFSSEGVLYDVLPGYAGFEDPGQPLHEEVVRLTGIADDQLLGQRLDDDMVSTLAGPANLILAHNASFDRCFLERRFPLSISPGRAPRARCRGRKRAWAVRSSIICSTNSASSSTITGRWLIAERYCTCCP
jgi:DNA polymerase III subunit epsilon